MAQFASDKNQRTLLVSRIDSKGGPGQEANTDEPLASPRNTNPDAATEGGASSDTVKFSLKVDYHGGNAHSIAFLKREQYGFLDLKSDETGDGTGKQLQLINLGYIGEDFNIFELAATYVEYSLLPLFNSYKVHKTSKGEASSAPGVDNIPKILSQLKVDLVQCQQNILVPEIMLKHEDEIRAKYDEQLKSNGAFVMSTDDFEQRIQDPKFVSKLEKTVTNWIRDIRRITQLTHDPSQGSAL